MSDFWIILTGSLVAVNCGLLGAFLILRRMAMVGDAISHAVLPGIVMAYLISGSRHAVVMLIGAAAFGLLTSFLIEVFKKRARLQADASIGITFTLLFAIGVVLLSAFSGNIDLDQECVLYGDIAYVPFDLLYSGGESYGPTPVWLQGGNLLVILAVLTFGYRGFFITGFDPGYAQGLGINTGSWQYLLMGMVSLTVVLSFNAVGAILVVAFLVVPPATAYLLSHNMMTMLSLTAVFGVASSLGGFYLAAWWRSSISASMAVMAGLLFATVFLLLKIQNRLKKSRRVSRFAESKTGRKVSPQP
jgi:manganese/zinc/iron transport system permease protein